MINIKDLNDFELFKLYCILTNCKDVSNYLAIGMDDANYNRLKLELRNLKLKNII